MRIIYLIIVLFLTLAIIFTTLNLKNENYNLLISVEFNNLDKNKIDEIFAKNIQKICLKSSKIKNIITISSYEKLNIYLDCKNKEEIFNLIENFIKNSGFAYEIVADFDFENKYNFFIIINSNRDLWLTKDKENELLKLLEAEKISKKIKPIKTFKKTINIDFKNEQLQELNISVSDLKKIILERNSTKNSTEKITTNSIINSISDIKELSFKYQNDNFQTKLENYFEIKKSFKTPKYGEIIFNNQNSNLIAIKLNIISYFKLLFLLNKLNKNNEAKYHLYDLKLKSRLIIRKPQNLENLENKFKKNNLKVLIFNSLDSPKIYSKDIFFETNTNEIIIFFNKYDYFKVANLLKKEKINFKSKEQKKFFNSKEELIDFENKINQNLKEELFYEINQKSLCEYFLNTQDVLDYIFSKSEGLKIDDFFDKEDKIEIYLKNNQNFNYIYSKKYKNFIFEDEIFKIQKTKTLNNIKCKNLKYFSVFTQ